jgi:hypothetical protein
VVSLANCSSSNICEYGLLVLGIPTETAKKSYAVRHYYTYLLYEFILFPRIDIGLRTDLPVIIFPFQCRLWMRVETPITGNNGMGLSRLVVNPIE